MLKILIVQTSFIGDVVLATALAEKLHQTLGDDAQIDFLVRKGNESMFNGHPFVRKVWVWDRKKHKHRNLLALAKSVKHERYHKLINLQRFFSSGLLSVLSGAAELRGFDKNPFSAFYHIKVKHQIKANGTLHEVERNQLLITDLTDGIAAKPRLYPQMADFEHVAQYAQEPYIVIAPCSAWYTKQYPAAQWAAFIAMLPPNLKVYLIGAPADTAVAQQIIGLANKSACIDLCGKLSFLQSAALMASARMSYVNDSAPLHFASAMNAPVTAIFCSTLPQFGYGPLSDDSAVIQSAEELPCKPCGLHGHKQCPKGHFKCAYTILNTSLLERLND